MKLKLKPKPFKLDSTLKLSLTIYPLYRNTAVDNLLRLDKAGEICLIEVEDSPAIWSSNINSSEIAFALIYPIKATTKVL